MHWFTISWWKYLFHKPFEDYNGGKLKSFFITVICRSRGHPYGVVYYNPNELEPDMTCKNCGDDLR